MQDAKNNLRRQNGFSLGKFWREYNGAVPMIAGATTALLLSAAAGVAEVLATGGSNLYSGGLVEAAKTAYVIGSHRAGECLVPGFLGGQFVGYKAKMAIKPILGLK